MGCHYKGICINVLGVILVYISKRPYPLQEARGEATSVIDIYTSYEGRIFKKRKILVFFFDITMQQTLLNSLNAFPRTIPFHALLCVEENKHQDENKSKTNCAKPNFIYLMCITII